MNKDLPTFKQAQEEVKINHFTKQGWDIRGIVHVGAHNGYEAERYLQMGIENILLFEPLTKVYSELRSKFYEEIKEGKVITSNMALGNKNEVKTLLITAGDGQGSSFLPLIGEDKSKPYYQDAVDTQASMIRRYADLMNEEPYSRIDKTKFNCLVIDAQGMELDVLEGMEDYLRLFDFINVECSLRPIYDGEVSGYIIQDYLNEMGFYRDSEIEEHNDVFYIRKGLEG